MMRSLPLFSARPPVTRPSLPFPELITELQSLGVRLEDPRGPGLSRKGGAGPSDHKALTLANQTVMVPIFTHASSKSPYSAEPINGQSAMLFRNGEPVAEVKFPPTPRFYSRSTADGVPYWKIATLHGRDVLATTVLQTCIRYGHRSTSCQFCAIGQSLAAKSTVPEKTPAQLAEVAKAAVELDGVKHAVLTTGTPNTPDRGAAVLANVTRAMKNAVDLPIQAQCEPPADFAWFSRLRDAGVDSLGMHLEAVTEPVRRRIMPGKAEVAVATYFEAFASAVSVFGRGQVSTYILAGLGDTHREIVDACSELVRIGVYPFVVPFVPIGGTPLERHPAPNAGFMESLLSDIAALLDENGMTSGEIKAGCGRCGACSSLRAREGAKDARVAVKSELTLAHAMEAARA
ncbi:MAG TPA: MSMEG_0568 family radical SAM protein [Polyangiaceae bacterium]|nr:MSMEG_0568 family radical SAM protein [Polyangiaceae bacterium]